MPKDWKEEFDKHFDSPGDLMSYEPIKVFISFLLSQQRKNGLNERLELLDSIEDFSNCNMDYYRKEIKSLINKQ